ncbi:mRNA export factor GLE1 isoform X2 [Prosopis cineraria]|uniref:mRNA export factor GLE1 isoform X2 n=1 Tax=Prosopis cineraria TaxID=364024 RepID=UPI00241034D8|nr:mRNA export factor GLE1 isoform X2 [Prosopis cineraria]
MEAVKLDLRCPQRAEGIAAEPEPDWTFNALVAELNALEMKLTASCTDPFPTKSIYSGNEIERGRPFMLHAPEYEMEDTETEDEQDETIEAGKRFGCNEIYLSDSDSSDIVPAFEVQGYLMDRAGEVEGALLELTHEHQLRVKDDIRNQISALETALMNESEKSASVLLQIEKYKEVRQELDKKFDTQYQRRIAEKLDNHLTAVQQDRELRSQIEERKIRSDAAYEETKRKEKAIQEEKLRQEKAKAEAEAAFRAEEAKRAALEAERRAAMEAEKRAAKEAIEKNAMESSKRITSEGLQLEATAQTDGASSLSKAESKEPGYTYRAADSALKLEALRLQKLRELYERNQAIRSGPNKDFSHKESHIARLIRQIRGVTDNVRSKASDLIKLLNDPQCPQSISAEIFARKVVSYCENPGNAAFASGYVIVLVTSQVPHVMDFLLAEFHRACIYTVPKHIVYKKSTFESREAYFKSVGYKEYDGKIESTEDYLKRLESYIKLYGALVQTQIPNVPNSHGLEEGWAWLARFLNNLPANKYTAVSLNAFLQMAGFGLYRRYKSQFLKMLKVISDNFLVDLKQKEPELTRIIVEIQSYIEDKKYLKEPEGRSLQSNLLSSIVRA